MESIIMGTYTHMVHGVGGASIVAYSGPPGRSSRNINYERASHRV